MNLETIPPRNPRFHYLLSLHHRPAIVPPFQMPSNYADIITIAEKFSIDLTLDQFQSQHPFRGSDIRFQEIIYFYYCGNEINCLEQLSFTRDSSSLFAARVINNHEVIEQKKKKKEEEEEEKEEKQREKEVWNFSSFLNDLSTRS